MKLFLLASLAFFSTSIYAEWTNESEVGILLAHGNSTSESYTAKETAAHIWKDNSLKFNGRYLQTKTNDIENAHYWSLGLRYDHALNEKLGVYFGEMVESDRYAGYNQKYNSDIGARYSLIKETKFVWDVEAGYRYTIENQIIGVRNNLHYARGYTEATKTWTEGVFTKFWFEYLPNLTIGSDYQMNSEISLSAALNNMVALKTAYLLRYDNLKNPGAIAKTDTLLTTSLVATF